MEHEKATTIEPTSESPPRELDGFPDGSEGSVESTGARETRSNKKSRGDAKRRLRAEVAELREQLREKESLVQALTQRLEQAAEQLDRIRRTGGDRGLHLTGGLPVELVESQKTLIEKLEHAIEQWEDLQAAAALGRLEVQISELRDLIAGRLSDGAFAGLGRAETGGSPDASPDSDTTSDSNSWEAMKAQLLAGAEGGSDPPDSINPTAGETSAESGSEQSDSQPPAADPSTEEPSSETATPIPEVPPPEPIELDQADIDQLREAVETRDAYICYLLKKLKVAPTIAPPVDWDSLQSAPEELKQKLQELADQLNEKLRMAEVDLSLERARLAREEAALRLREEQLEQRLKQYGLEESPSGDLESDSKRKRRWLKFLARDDEGS